MKQSTPFDLRTPPLPELSACLGCGYSMEGLPADSKCPECGRTVGTADARRIEMMSVAQRAWLWLVMGLGVYAIGSLACIFAFLQSGSKFLEVVVGYGARPSTLALTILLGMLLVLRTTRRLGVDWKVWGGIWVVVVCVGVCGAFIFGQVLWEGQGC